ncbi:MAG: transglycosylase SLT domain-containing protein [Anaerolineales bacterium]
MPRARTNPTIRQTAASSQEEGSGCLSGFMLIPLTVILSSLFLASLAMKTNPQQPLPSANQNLIISSTFTPEIQYWAGSISRWAIASGLDPNLIATIMQIESCGDPRATSHAGAMGLFQVMPFHFQLADDPYNPETNALRGLSYLKRSLDSANGNVRLALAGYNGGIGIIRTMEWSWPAETKRYVLYGEPIYNEARSGTSSNTSVQEWYSNYGASLCRQASQRLGLQ